jgi:sugar O-acyltransferase (sialic acid O-acetyltransferase NeuD family)
VKQIIILGTGGNCIDILDALDGINRASNRVRYRCVGFLDDNESLHGTTVGGIPIVGPLSAADAHSNCLFVFGIGSPLNHRRRRAILQRCHIPPERFETVVHPSAVVSPRARLGRGVVVFPHVTVGSSAVVGDHVLLLPSCVISHDDVLGDFTCVAAGASVSGHVTIGDSCYLGTRSAIIGHVSIGPGALIGMGAVVLHDVPPNVVVAGNPARILRRYEND